MKVSIYIDRVVAMKAGKDKYGLYGVEFPAGELTVEQRETLSRFVSSGHCDSDFTLSYHGMSKELEEVVLPLCLEPTKEVVIAVIDVIVARDRRDKAAKALREKDRKPVWDRIAEMLGL